MLARLNHLPSGLRRLGHTVTAAVIALTLIVVLGMALNGASAMRIDPDRGPGPSHSFCSGIASTYQMDVFHLANAHTSQDAARYYDDVTYDLAYWNGSGCQSSWGNIDDWYLY
jgi:hypothetical protein